MRIISFAWTTPAFKALQKTCTRREWNDSYAESFARGQYLAAYDRTPRYGGKQIGIIQLTCDPYKEWSNLASMPDYRAEGFTYLESIGARVNGLTPAELWEQWHVSPRYLWVVRFEIVGVS